MGWVKPIALLVGASLLLGGGLAAIGGNAIGLIAMLLAAATFALAFADLGLAKPAVRADALTPGYSTFKILYNAKNKKGTAQVKRAWFDQVDVRTLDGEKFEWWVAEALRRQGWFVEITASSGDYGADLIATKNGQRMAVQVKRYEKQVGVTAVQQVMGGAAHWRCAEKMVVTTAKDFTPAAKKLAATTGTQLVTGHVVERWRIRPDVPSDRNAIAAPAPPATIAPARRSRRFKDVDSLDPYGPKAKGFWRGFWAGLTGRASW